MATRKDLAVVAEKLWINIDGKTDAAAAQLILAHVAENARSQDLKKLLSQNHLNMIILQNIITSGNHTTTNNQIDRGNGKGKKGKHMSKDRGQRMARR